MKDLYKRIGLPSQTDDLEEIKNAIQSYNGSCSVKESAQHILLDIDRKKVYDRNHNILTIIGKIRADLGLNRTALWLSVQSQDFDAEPSNPPEKTVLKQNRSLLHTFLDWILFLLSSGSPFICLVKLALMVCACILFVYIVYYVYFFNKTSTLENQSTNSYKYSPPVARRPAPQQELVSFNEPVVPFPMNGTLTRYHTETAIAPLEIKTRSGSGHYYIKLVDWYTKKPVLTVFIRDGQSVEIDVPLGSFELKYAVGKTWYGEKHLFGPATACSKADDRFDFKESAGRISGYTVELYLQVNGNLDTDPIPVSQF